MSNAPEAITMKTADQNLLKSSEIDAKTAVSMKIKK